MTTPCLIIDMGGEQETEIQLQIKPPSNVPLVNQEREFSLAR